MRGKKNPPLKFVPVVESAPVTYDSIAQAYLEEYVLHCYKTLTTARARVEHCAASLAGGTLRRSHPIAFATTRSAAVRKGRKPRR
jgi:hypothetical protein